MSFLLDTHVWIWSQQQPDKLGPQATRDLSDPITPLFVSTVSTLEIARLLAAKRIELTGTLQSWISDSLDLLLCKSIEVSHQIALEAYSLPGAFHKDPADRILVATARLHGLTVLTADERILDYGNVKAQDASL